MSLDFGQLIGKIGQHLVTLGLMLHIGKIKRYTQWTLLAAGKGGLEIEFLKQSKDDQLVVRSRSSKEKFWTSQEYFLREIEKKRNYERESSQLRVRRRLPKTV